VSDSKVRGVVHVAEATKSYGAKGFRKRLLVLEQENGKFPSYIPVEFIGDKCSLADNVQAGDEVEVTYRLGGRKWQQSPSSEAKYFLSAEATEIAVLRISGEAPSGGADATDAPF
jgi:hypothetical protein